MLFRSALSRTLTKFDWALQLNVSMQQTPNPLAQDPILEPPRLVQSVLVVQVPIMVGEISQNSG